MMRAGHTEPRGRGGVVTLASVAILALIVVGCASTENGSDANVAVAPATAVPDTEQPRDGGLLTFGLAAESSGWNPFSAQWAASGYIVANAIFDPLAAVDPDGRAQPYLAEALTPTADFRSWTIRLRPGVTFQNDEKLDAAALKLNLDAARTTGLTAQALSSITAVEASDDRTVVVTTSQPWSTFAMALTGQPGYVAAPAMLQDPKEGARHPIGTGPFSFQSWTPDATLTVRKNPHYWQAGLPHLDGIEFKVLADSTSRQNALEAKSVDAIEVNTASALLDAQKSSDEGRTQVINTAGRESDETIIALNTAKEPFDDPVARRAIAVGLDQGELSQQSFEGALPAAWGPFAEGSPYFLSRVDAGYPAYDPAEARRLVDEYQAQHGKPLRFTALIPPDPAYAAIAQTLQAQAKSFGVTVDLQTVEQTTLITSVLSGNYQSSGFVLFSSPTLDRAYPFIATKPVAGLSLNFTRDDNPRITDAMNAARATDDRTEQIRQYQIVQREMAKDLDRIFLVHNITAVESDPAARGIGAGTLPGTTTPAYAGLAVTTPFLAATWVRQ